MRAGNNKLTVFLIALIAAVTVGVALRQQLDTLQTPPETPPVETPAPTATPIPVSDMRGKVLISEIMEKNRSVAADEDGDFPDWFELWNTTDGVLYLNGWRIADRPGRIGWSIPPLRILGGDHVVIYASRKDRAGEELHTDCALSEEDCLCLYDADGAYGGLSELAMKYFQRKVGLRETGVADEATQLALFSADAPMAEE